MKEKKEKEKEKDEAHWPANNILDKSFANDLQQIDDMKQISKQDFDDKLIAIEMKLLNIDDKVSQIFELLKKLGNYFI